MTRLFLAAGVAALAIATPLAARPGGGNGGGHGNGGGGGGAPAFAGGGGGGHGHGGGGGDAATFNAGGGGGHGHGGGAPAFFGGGGGRGHGGGAPQFMSFGGGGGGHGHGGRAAAPQMRVERQQGHQQVRGFERREARQQIRGIERREARQQARGFERREAHQQVRGFERQQARAMEHQHGQNRFAGQDVERGKRIEQVQREVVRNEGFGGQRMEAFRNAPTTFVDDFGGRGRGLIDGCPPGLWMKSNGCMPPGQAAKLLGAPLTAAAGMVPLSVMPQSLSYLYPDTSDYYWRYGNGYLYQVDRDTALISSLLPLFGGGYVPGTYLPASYMDSYVPDYWGLNSFYPDYGGVCNRYDYGVVYQVDCASGFVENVIPMYAGGYGVGQMLPSAYNYYNVPLQYRDLYYDTADTGYWYAPGAIYQYDPRTNFITSVAALTGPGFSIGQPLPMGYDVYNVPYDYRQTYYDTPTAWYRYNNGYIYQVDPVTQIVTAIVASLLT